MTPTEINERLAKAMGWTVLGEHWVVPDPRESMPIPQIMFHVVGNEHMPRFNPSGSRDDLALVEAEIERRGYQCLYDYCEALREAWRADGSDISQFEHWLILLKPSVAAPIALAVLEGGAK